MINNVGTNIKDWNILFTIHKNQVAEIKIKSIIKTSSIQKKVKQGSHLDYKTKNQKIKKKGNNRWNPNINHTI